MNLFEFATRNKLRFPYNGMVGVEDLWDLSPKMLDKVFKTLNSQKRVISEDSLFEEKNSEDMVLNTQIEIVKHIYLVKTNEHKETLRAVEKKKEKEQLLEIYKRKKDKTLEDLSMEDLEKLISEL